MTTFARRSLLAAALTVLLGVAGCAGPAPAADSSKRQKITVLTGFGKLGQDAYLFLGRDKGWFTEQGIDLDIQAGRGTNDNLKLILAGQAQFATVDMTGALIAYGTGVRHFTTVAAIYQRSVSTITTLDGGRITGPKDLAGKTIAFTPGGVNKTLFPAYAKVAGLDTRAITWRSADPQSMRGLLASGKVDAITETVIGTPGVQAAANGRKPVVLAYNDLLSDLYGNVIVTGTGTAKDTDLVSRFRTALLRSLTEAIKSPAAAAAAFHRSVPAYPLQTATAEVGLMASYVSANGATGSLDRPRVARSVALLQSLGAVKEPIHPDDVLDPASLSAAG